MIDPSTNFHLIAYSVKRKNNNISGLWLLGPITLLKYLDVRAGMAQASNHPHGLARWPAQKNLPRQDVGLKTWPTEISGFVPKFSIRIKGRIKGISKEWHLSPDLQCVWHDLVFWICQNSVPKSSSSLWPAQGPGAQLPETAMLLVVT